jgi:hypothetical protein
LRRQAAAEHRTADDYEEKARKRDRQADKLTVELVTLGAAEAQREEHARAVLSGVEGDR